jgi:hypothetical protein
MTGSGTTIRRDTAQTIELAARAGGPCQQREIQAEQVVLNHSVG